MAESEIGFGQLGLASILKQNQLAVPPNQREYSWTVKEVRTLFQDFARAIQEGDSKSYFLGTIVTIPRTGSILEVVDGQQRLATTAILLAAIRDYLKPRETMIAESIDSEFLTVINRATRARVPRLRLNLDDNDYFRARLTSADPVAAPTKPSHDLLNAAFIEASDQVRRIVAVVDEKDAGDTLNRWITFAESRALAVLLRVPNDADAYRMFETLNDRGLRTSQSDLVKNYLFGRAGDRIGEVQQKWSFMRGALETIEEEDITITFLRHALTLIQGVVRETQVYETVQGIAKAAEPVVTFSGQLEVLANGYVAIHNPEHEKWNKSDATRRAIEVLNLFDIKPMRPLMLAIGHRLADREAEKAFQFCVSLGVRLMITTSTRSGTIEEGLATGAHKIFAGEITTAAALKAELKTLTPTDASFSAAFEVATVSSRKLARYYLRSMELAAKNEAEPWHIPNDDRSAINLEHILPEKPEGNWPKFSDEEVRLYYKRVGNLCLMKASDNSTAKSAGFAVKKPIYAKSTYELTRQLGEAAEWTSTEIISRQKTLAAIALKAWPI
ncbi:MAG TPA: DUF262 domain-containing protein [Rhizomicrobium sp.]|jgi:hypothetical protein|nr:DUF262 domain-containing protein [Rhizomicrobium sp.]